jgi:hypothetical protein
MDDLDFGFLFTVLLRSPQVCVHPKLSTPKALLETETAAVPRWLLQVWAFTVHYRSSPNVQGLTDCHFTLFCGDDYTCVVSAGHTLLGQSPLKAGRNAIRTDGCEQNEVDVVVCSKLVAISDSTASRSGHVSASRASFGDSLVLSESRVCVRSSIRTERRSVLMRLRSYSSLCSRIWRATRFTLRAFSHVVHPI